ncbi:hypothetical protein, partial [Streptomyces erythrochromogenes]|uniref:hypothetical protein n=1 Tax=Streptomyces erythrochromogenes TaxID=285574 RepID=UPI0036CBD41D
MSDPTDIPSPGSASVVATCPVGTIVSGGGYILPDNSGLDVASMGTVGPGQSFFITVGNTTGATQTVQATA